VVAADLAASAGAEILAAAVPAAVGEIVPFHLIKLSYKAKEILCGRVL